MVNGDFDFCTQTPVIRRGFSCMYYTYVHTYICLYNDSVENLHTSYMTVLRRRIGIGSYGEKYLLLAWNVLRKRKKHICRFKNIHCHR